MIAVKTASKIALATVAVILCAALVSCHKKTEQEKILDCFNGYLKEHALGNYDKSYQYLASSEKAQRTEKDWITKNLQSLNAIRLMKNIRLTNLKINGDTAEATVDYVGIPPEKLAEVAGGVYANNVSKFYAERNALVEKTLLDSWDTISAPMSRPVKFVKEGGDWKLIL